MKKKIYYGQQWIDDDDIDAIIKVLKSDFLTTGPTINRLEENIAEYVGAKYAIAVANGTAALHLAVKVLEIENGRQGITSPITFIASSNSFIYNELIPEFADIKSDTYNIDPDQIEKKITKDTRVIIPVHFAGQPANINKIKKIIKEKEKLYGNRIYIIEDAAHAIGSRDKNNNLIGSCKYSDMSIFSFHPVKTIATGEGGAITTNDKEIYEKLKVLRNHGIIKNNSKFKIQNSKLTGPWYYEMQELGYNYRITDLQAALGISQLNRIENFIKRRREIVENYNEVFKGVDWLTTPYEKDDVLSAFHLYVLKIDLKFLNKTRAEVMEELKSKGIYTQVHYIPVHLQPYYRENYNFKEGDFPVAEKYYENCLTIPLYPKMTNGDIGFVIKEILSLK